MSMTVKDYITAVKEQIIPNQHKYIHLLIGLGNVKVPTVEALHGYYRGCDITATREAFNLIEGLSKAFDNVVFSRVECYNPCMNMIDEINKVIHNGYEYTPNGYDKLERDYVFQEDGLFTRVTHPESLEDMYRGMSALIGHRVYNKHHFKTVILYTEAVLLQKFDAFWDVSTVSISEMKSMIAHARQADADKLVESCISNTIYLAGGDRVKV